MPEMPTPISAFTAAAPFAMESATHSLTTPCPYRIPPQRSRISPLLGLHMSRMRHREHTKRSARPRYVRRQARPCRIPQRKYAGQAYQRINDPFRNRKARSALFICQNRLRAFVYNIVHEDYFLSFGLSPHIHSSHIYEFIIVRRELQCPNSTEKCNKNATMKV